MARSDMIHVSMCADSGSSSETKSQKLSWRGLGLREAPVGLLLGRRGMMSGNLIASWMKNTGMLFPTRSPVAFPGIETSSRSRPHVASPGRLRPLFPATVENLTKTGRTQARLRRNGSALGDVGKRLVILEVPVRPVNRGRAPPRSGIRS